jgi:hypothetical protein
VNANQLIRSGWWVVVAALGVSVLVIVALLRLPRVMPAADERGPIALEPCLVDRATLVRAMDRDGLKALDNPAFMTPAEVASVNEHQRGKLLVSSDLVIGVELGGDTRAYPLRLLRWHEVVNDVVGGHAVAVTHSPLTGSVAVWDRTRDGTVLEIAVSGWLSNSNTLLYERQAPGHPSSLWHQLTGEAVAGPAAGERLTPLPATLRTWAEWTHDHPETTVMAPDEGSKRLYKRDPYHSYRGSEVLRFPVDPLPPVGLLARKDLAVAVTTATGDAVFPLPYLAMAAGAQRGTWAALIDDRVFVIDFDADAGTFAIEARDRATPAPPARIAYWFEWYAIDPGIVPLP